MYQLYFVKEVFKIIIEPLKVSTNDVTDTPRQFNNCVYVCSDRKALRELAKKIKAEWITELEERLEKANNVKVKNKY